MSFLNPDHHQVYECLNPTKLYKAKIPVNSEKVSIPLVDRESKEFVYNKQTGEPKYVVKYKNYKPQPMYVPCGHCVNCRRKKSRQWQARLAWHNRFISRNYVDPHVYFISLSFDDYHLPEHIDNSNLAELESYKYVQQFIKTLRQGTKGIYRKSFKSRCQVLDPLPPLEFEFYCVGEFGDSDKGTHRFHYHIVMFLHNDSLIPDYFLHDSQGKTINCLAPDYKYKTYPATAEYPFILPLRLCRINSGYKSDRKTKIKKRLQTGKEATFQYILSQRWKYGIVSVGSSDTNGSFSYLGKYSTSSIEDHSSGLRPFHRQSLGLGSNFFIAFANDIYKGSVYVMPLDPLHSKFRSVPIPSYYLKKYGDEEARIRWCLDNIPDRTYQLDLKYNSKIP